METLGVSIVTVIFTAGAAWGAVKVSLNGTRERVKEIAADTKEIRTKVADHGERLARVEATLNVKG